MTRLHVPSVPDLLTSWRTLQSQVRMRLNAVSIDNAVSIEVVSLHGDIPLSLNVPDSMTGRELQQMI